MSSDSMMGGASKPTFFKHVFNFDEHSQKSMINISQYALLAIIPIVTLNKSIQRFVPEADPDKSSIEILAEICIQVIVMFIGVFFIHRIITFIPTFSGTDYDEFQVTEIILAVLLISLSIQSRLGSKTSILADRVMDLWNGTTALKKEGMKASVSQPIIGMTGGQMVNDTTPIHSLPSRQPAMQPQPDMMNGGGIMAANDVNAFGGGSLFGSMLN